MSVLEKQTGDESRVQLWYN